MLFQPMPLSRAEPFDHPDWLFEIKWDGFHAVLYSDSDSVRLISRDGNTFKSFPDLCKGLVRDLNGRRCILDGEIVCLDSHGQPQFRKWIGREELFERERATHPNWHYWDACALVTDQIAKPLQRAPARLRCSVSAFLSCVSSL